MVQGFEIVLPLLCKNEEEHNYIVASRIPTPLKIFVQSLSKIASVSKLVELSR